MISTLLLTAAALAAPPAANRGGEWIADWDAAAKLAKESGKDLLVDFTGSDWCGWCVKLHDEVFKHDEFLKGVGDRYVLVALDFPRDEAVKAKVPNPARNSALQKRYHIRGFPTILLMAADGDVIGQTGYQPGGPAAYLTHLEELRTAGLPLLAEQDAMEAKIAAANGAEKVALIEEAITRLAGLTEENGFLGTKFGDLVRLGIAADPDNKSGLQRKSIEALLKAGQLDDALATEVRKLDPKNEAGLLERVVAAEMGTIGSEEEIAPFVKKIDELVAFGPLKDKQVALEICVNAAFFNHRFLKNAEAAKKYATMAKESGQELNPQVKQLIDSILGG